MPFSVAAAAVGVAGSVIGSKMQGDAVKDAQSSANAEQRAARDQARQDMAPWVQTGTNALTSVGDLSGANGLDAAKSAQANFLQSPGYDWQYQQGLRGIDAGAAKTGMLRSGATLKAEQEFGQGLAKQDFATYYNRLAGLAELGQKSAAGQASTSSEAGRGIAQTDVSAGRNMASIYGNEAEGISNAIGGALGDKGVQNSLTKLWGGGGGGAVGGGFGM